MKKIIIIPIFLSIGFLKTLAQTPTAGKNAIMEKTPREAMTTVAGATHTTVQTAIRYFDGLARPTQTVLYRASPDATKDIVASSTEYDGFGNPYKNTLPTPSDVATGAYSTTVQTLAESFYNDTHPYQQSVFEKSPLNRVAETFGAGQAWRVLNNEKSTKIAYGAAGDEILEFRMNATGGVDVLGAYGGSSLYVQTITSERGFRTNEYKDRLGRVVAKSQELTKDVFAVTGFIYDDLNRLRIVVQPEAYKTVSNMTNFTQSSAVFREGMFYYLYDSRGRVAEKHVPGGGTRYSIYDKNDREVMFADDADKAKNYWRFRKFDIFGREIMNGLINNIGTFTRSQLQQDFDDFTGQSYEIISNAGLLGYSNISFPSSYTPGDGNVKEVRYYDDYTWQRDASYNFQAANAFHPLGLSKGLLTGKIKRNIRTGTWQKIVLFYNYQGRLIQDWHLTNKGNLIRKDYQYRFNGELLKMRIVKGNNTKIFTYQYNHAGQKTSFVHNGKPIAQYSHDAIGRLQNKKFSPSGTTQGSKQTGNWTDASNWLSGTLPTLADNVTINTGQTLTIPTGEQAFAGTLNNKGILQNFGTLNMGKATSADLYWQSYTHHIRGGLKGINLDASGNLMNSLFSYKIDYENGTNGYFDGNISKQTWQSNIDNKERSYTHTYDGGSRLKSSTYSSTQVGESYALNNVNYDDNGNILNLSRNGATNSNYTAFGNVDNMNYTYQSNSNKLLNIQDGTTTNTDLGDFRNGTNMDDDYDYWLDGSLKRDRNKKIASITYNYLKLPEVITFDDNKTITTEYDSEGIKLKKIVSGGETTDYEEDEIYVNDVLYQTVHDEGRINSQGEYEYNINDHLGNLRVSFRDSLGVAVPVQSIFYDPWGLSMKGMQISRNAVNFNKFQYNGKEMDLTSGYIDFGARMYGAAEGRWFTIDPKSELMARWSPFCAFFDNPIRFIDVDGMIPLPVNALFKKMGHRIDSWFGPRNTGIKGASKNHKGLDINFGSGQADKGAPVLTTHDGVAKIDNDPAGKEGRMVVITSTDGKFRTKYLHLSKINIGDKQKVNEASQIGEIGGSGYGSETGQQTHLHYSIEKLNEETGEFEPYNPTEGKEHKESNIVDPQTWIKKPLSKLIVPNLQNEAPSDATRVERMQFFNMIQGLTTGSYKVVNGKIVPQ
jgi:RHS repeat-associated protein